MRSLVAADPRVIADPVATVLLERSAGDALKTVVSFSTAGELTTLVKSDLIKAVHAALEARPGK